MNSAYQKANMARKTVMHYNFSMSSTSPTTTWRRRHVVSSTTRRPRRHVKKQ